MVSNFSRRGSLEYSVYYYNSSIETPILVFCSYYAGKCCLHCNEFLYGQTGRTKEERQNKKAPIRSIPVFSRSVARHVHCLRLCSMIRAILRGIYSVAMFHVGASFISLAPIFMPMAKIRAHSLRCSSFSK